MICEFKVDKSYYYFDGNSMLIYKDFLPDVLAPHAEYKKEDDQILYKALINVSNECNGKCVYCYENGGDFGKTKALMDTYAANRCLDYLFSHYRHVKNIEFFGGEPTLNFPIIQYIVSKVNKVNFCDAFIMVTNATGLTDSMLNFFVKNDFNIIVSLDGPAEVHDALRKNCPHKTVLEAIKKIQDSPIGGKLELNCTYTRYHNEHIGYEKLCEYFENVGARFIVSEVKTDIPELSLPEPSIDDEKASIKMSYERLVSDGENCTISKYVKSLICCITSKKFHNRFCDNLSPSGIVTFNVHAERYPCEALLYCDDIDSEHINHCNNKNNKICNNCWAQGMCTHCVADFITHNQEFPYDGEVCYKEKLYRYAMELLLEYYDKDPVVFQRIIEKSILL